MAKLNQIKEGLARQVPSHYGEALLTFDLLFSSSLLAIKKSKLLDLGLNRSLGTKSTILVPRIDLQRSPQSIGYAIIQKRSTLPFSLATNPQAPSAMLKITTIQPATIRKFSHY